MQLEPLARDVYACLQPDRGLGCSNSGLVARAGGLVIDTFWDLPHTRELLREYSRVCPQPARRVVNTHENGDHCWGNQLFPGAEIIAQRQCAEAMGRESPALLQALASQTGSADPAIADLARRLAAFDFSGIEITPPTRSFDARLSLDQDSIRVELIHVGPAHTAGDCIVHLPEQGILFAGDVLFRLCTPIGWAGSYAGWFAALDTIVELAPEIIVPGHGPLCGVEGPKELRAYLAYVRDESRRHFDAGVPSIEAAKHIDLGPYAGWTEPERIVFNVERAYREFQGDPWDTPLDPVALFRAMHDVKLHHETTTN